MNQNLWQQWQSKILLLCWLAYAAIYFGRVNLAIALPSIQSTFGWSKAEIGALGTVFFWVYGTGQLLNGYIGDRSSSRVLVFLGLCISALVNLTFGFVANLQLMVILWSINGYFQSMLWGPIVKTLSNWFYGSGRDRVAVKISTSMVGGYLLAWGASGTLVAHLDWRYAFWLPGVVVLIYSFIWYRGIRNHPRDAGALELMNEADPRPTITPSNDTKSDPFWLVFKKTRLWLIVTACLAQGVVKDGIALWAPTFLIETHGLALTSAVPMVVFIPCMNFAGILFAGWLNQRLKRQSSLAVALVMGGAFLAVLGLIQLGARDRYLGLFFLSLTSAMMFAANTILLSIIPMTFARYSRASGVAGFLDFASYLAAGTAAAVTGLVVDQYGWTLVLTIWSLVCIAGGCAALIHWNGQRKTGLFLTT